MAYTPTKSMPRRVKPTVSNPVGKAVPAPARPTRPVKPVRPARGTFSTGARTGVTGGPVKVSKVDDSGMQRNPPTTTSKVPAPKAKASKEALYKSIKTTR